MYTTAQNKHKVYVMKKLFFLNFLFYMDQFLVI